MAEENNTGATAVLEDADEQELVTCILDEVEFGLDINAVQEIVRLPKITPVPKAPAYVTGVANLRGNVLPIINSRTRFGMPACANAENNRVVVVELNGQPTGLIVDAVREVMHVRKADVENTPAAVSGVDSKFLSGIVRLDGGKRLVMLLDHDSVIDSADFPVEEDRGREETSCERGGTDNQGRALETEQLVTFRVANEEYAISIMDVQEIIRVPQITRVPHAPEGIEGVTSLRSRVLPVMDLRTKFGLDTLASETGAILRHLQDMVKSQEEWIHLLQESGSNEAPFHGEWIEASAETMRELKRFAATSKPTSELLAAIRNGQEALRAAAKPVVAQLKAGEFARARKDFSNRVLPAHSEVTAAFRKLIGLINSRDDERCLVVTVGRTAVALRIDAVHEVLQVPKDSVEPTPEITSGSGATRDQIRGVAKLDQGRRLIMLLDVRHLVSEAQLQDVAAEAAQEHGDLDKDTLGRSSVVDDDERQLVSFRVAEEEFATDIMQVQEIIRLEKVTKVPHAPGFVEGVVNLRGNVLPVIDLRRRFGMPAAAYSDATRVVVVDIQGRKTGIIVDSVSEVMRLARGSIEPAPAIIGAGHSERFIEGVGKLNGGERMLLLLRADRLLSEEEIGSLDGVGDRPEPVSAQ